MHRLHNSERVNLVIHNSAHQQNRRSRRFRFTWRSHTFVCASIAFQIRGFEGQPVSHVKNAWNRCNQSSLFVVPVQVSIECLLLFVFLSAICTRENDLVAFASNRWMIKPYWEQYCQQTASYLIGTPQSDPS